MLRRAPCSTLFPYTTLFRSIRNYLELRLEAFRRMIRQHVERELERRAWRQGEKLQREALSDKPLFASRWSLDRKSTRLNSSHVATSYAVFCLKKKINGNTTT